MTTTRFLARRAWWLATLPVLVAMTLMGGAAPAQAAPLTAFFLGYEQDQCSGNLYVLNSSGSYQFIPRDDAAHTVNVHVDGNAYWYWKCGTSGERSRGESAWWNRVEQLRVVHSTDSRQIGWY